VKNLIEEFAKVQSQRGVSFEQIKEALEVALKKTYKKEKGLPENDPDIEERITVSIDLDSGAVELYFRKDVVNTVRDPRKEISVEELRKRGLTEYSVGDSYEEKEPLAFSRVGIAVLRDVFSQRIRDMERENFYSTLSAQLGELMKARPYKIDANGDAHLEIEGMEKVDGILMRRDMIPGEIYKPKRQILVLVKKVDRLRSGDVVVYFTRVSEDFVRKLLEKEIVEVKEGIVEVLNVARIPGERTKISVRSNDPHVDPVGACVGARGDRIRRIMKEMNNERIDVIRWDEEPKRYIANALNPLVLKDYEERVIIEDEEEKRARVVVPDRDYSTAIGRKGANVKLASLLTGWDIRVVADRENMRIREVGDLEERIIDALESAGIERVWQLLKMSRGDLMEIAGLGEGEVSRIEEWLVEKQYIVVEGEEGEEVEEVIDDE